MSTRTYGWRPDTPDPRDRIFNLKCEVKQPHELPAKFSWREQMPPVYDQGALGSCTANGNAAVFERQEMAQGQPQVTPSRLFIYFCERAREGTIQSDSGAQVRTGIQVLASIGAPPESVWPYDIARFAQTPPEAAYAEAKKHEAIAYQRVLAGGAGAPVRTAIAEHGPVVFGFVVPERFESASWDAASEPLDLPIPGEQFVGGHCVVIVGYDFSRQRFPFDVFEIRNSWGAEWGDEGHFLMQAPWITEPQLRLSSDYWLVTRTS